MSVAGITDPNAREETRKILLKLESISNVLATVKADLVSLEKRVAALEAP